MFGNAGQPRHTALPASITRMPCSVARLRTAARSPHSARCTFLDVASQAGVGLPERHRAVVGVCVGGTLGQLLAGSRAEFLLGQARLDELDPVMQTLAKLPQMPRRILCDTEVDQCEAVGLTPLDLL